MTQPVIAPTSERADPVLDRLRGLHPKVIDLSLGRVHRLLGALGHPERGLAPVIHVAGTNGKGSTVAFLRAFLEAAGHRVHVYTSPHLVRFHERIRIGAPGGGRLIDDDALVAILEECEAANGGEPITYFEITTVAAFLAFARAPADVVLLETGLGGRLDATNVVDRPAVTAITRISMDHMQFLGDTIEAIAAEKAGIMKPGVPVVVAPQPVASVSATLANRAAAVGAPLIAHGDGWRAVATEDGFRFQSARRGLDLPLPGLAGSHQIINAGLAIACLDQLRAVEVDDRAVLKGLSGVEWPARMQSLTRGPLVEGLPAGWDLWLDGGHNDSAGEVVAAELARWRAADPDRPVVAIFGMLESKRPEDFLRPLAPHVTAVRGIAIPEGEASLSAEAAADAARRVGIVDVAPAADVQAALNSLILKAGRPCRVLICGSLYLAGAVLRNHR